MTPEGEPEQTGTARAKPTLTDVIVEQFLKNPRIEKSTHKDGGPWKLRREVETVLDSHTNQNKIATPIRKPIKDFIITNVLPITALSFPT